MVVKTSAENWNRSKYVIMLDCAKKINRHTAKLTPFATKTMELTALVPLPQGNTHFPETPLPRQDEPGPRTGSYPAAVASP